VFALTGLFDLALTWYPANFDSPEFQFASYSQTLNFLPLPVLGLLLMLAGGVARGIRWIPKFVVGVLVVLTVLLLVGAVFWAFSAVQGLSAVKDPLVQRGLKKAIAKTTLQAVVYPLAFLYVSVKAWRHATAMTKEVP
jgi:SNF family Na+-dependent transporter